MQPGFKVEQFSTPTKGYDDVLVQYNYPALNLVSTLCSNLILLDIIASKHTAAIFKIKYK